MNPLDTIQVNIHNSIAMLTIARAAKRNALDTACWGALAEACATLATRNDVKVVILTGEGAHFSAGADIHELSANMTDAAWMANNQATIALALDACAQLPQPTIASIRGACVGGGAALAAASDFRYCTSDARFAITPAKLGLTYRLVDCLRVVELVGAARAREILLLAKELDAETALHWGFVNEVAASDLDKRVLEVATQLTTLSAYSLRGIKASLLKIRAGQTSDDAATKEIFRNAFTGADFAEGAAAFIEKRVAKFNGVH
jgi:enoyl-CoA hydratase